MHTYKENPAARHAAGARSGVVAMGHLLSDMNHDIRTSMNGVRGMLDLLLGTGLTPAQQEYARCAQHGVDALLESLERIVDMSLIETDSFQLNRVPFDLRNEVEAALSGKAASAYQSGIDLKFSYPSPVRLLGDAARLREAISALCDVALQCAAGEHLSMSVRAGYQAGGMCRLTLDTVVPQSSEGSIHVASLMNDLGTEPGGMRSKDMLGLTICRQLVQKMKGTITIDRSRPPETVIRLCIDLPFAPDALAGRKVLLLAANPGQWQAAAAPMTRSGMEIDAFDAPLGALQALDAAARAGRPYHLVIIERHLPGMDAEVLRSAITADASHRRMQVVLLDEEDDAAKRELRLASLCMMASNGTSSPLAPRDGSKNASDMPSYSGCTVLVADDNPVNQQVAARMLEKMGCKTAVASDGMQAIEMHTWRRFDLILMDCDMPVLDGLEATQRIRSSEGDARRTPVIALTACTGQGEQERCLAAGMDDFLSKPIRPAMLADVLSKWLPQPSLATAASDAQAAQEACEDELDEIKEMFGADFGELAALYQKDGPPRLAAIREAAAAGDCARVAKVAHAFGGSCASIGATGLSALCKALETRAKEGTLDDIAPRMTAIENEYRRVCAKLQSLLAL